MRGGLSIFILCVPAAAGIGGDFIAIAGLSAALPVDIVSRTDKPVIGVPVSGTLNGMDSLLSIAQMPKGVPVACVGVDNGNNAT